MDGSDYDAYGRRLSGMSPAGVEAFILGELPRSLGEDWCRAYRADCPRAEILEVPTGTFAYLFDLTDERTLAAYGIMRGKNQSTRDHARMSGFPKYEGPAFHRGHLIPHSGHGGTDINLFVQLGSVNIGPFRALERQAVANPGSFYFVRLIYARGSSAQKPVEVQQGLVLKTDPPRMDVRVFAN